MKAKFAVLTVMLVVAVTALPMFAFGSRDKEPAANPDWTQVKEGDRVIVSGKIRLVGSAVSNSLVLTTRRTRTGTWTTPNAKSSPGWNSGDNPFRVVRLDPIKFADGTELPDKRVLTGIELVK